MKDHGQATDLLETAYNKGYAQGYKDCDTHEGFYEAKFREIQRKIENTGVQLKYMKVDELFSEGEEHTETVYKIAITQLRNNIVMLYEMLGGKLENG